MALPNKQYFPTIDGIRSIAVLSVILFHLDITLFKGGFVGVDIFFVISGFLITRNITTEITNNSFSFGRFYIARLRRLYPALITTIAITLFLALILFSPEHLKETAESSIAAAFSVANIYFWSSAGYFDTDSSFKPLLHYWSLSVEEQFYLIWPAVLCLILIKIRGTRGKVLAIFSLFLICLSIAEYSLADKPELTFYSFHTRAYEFLIGALLVWIPTKNISSRIQVSSILLGITLITSSIIFFNHETEFPGISALIPCLGTALLIVSRENRYSLLFLANPPARWVGKISYSLYLVHWPIWILFNYWKFEPTTAPEKLALFVSTFAAAQLLHSYIEQPFRKSSTESPQGSKRFLIFMSFLLAAIVLNAGAITYKEGLVFRVNSIHYKLNCHIVDNDNRRLEEKKCDLGSRIEPDRKAILIGDSHAEHLAYGLDNFSREQNMSLHAWTFSGCPPIWGVYRIYGLGSRKDHQKEEHCKELVKEWQKEIETGGYDLVILASRWAWNYEAPEYSSHRKPFRRFLLAEEHNSESSPQRSKLIFKEKMHDTVSSITTNKQTKVIIVSQIPVLGKNIQGCDGVPKYLYSDHQLAKRCDPGISYERQIARLKYTDSIIKGLETDSILPLIPSETLCSDVRKNCLTVWGKHRIYKDDNHFNANGSLRYIDSLKNKLTDFIKNQKTINEKTN